MRLAEWRFCIASLLIGLANVFCFLGSVHADATEQELGRRYAPYADWRRVFESSGLKQPRVRPIWWRTPESIRSNRDLNQLPLAGLILAIDPGHIGGAFASGGQRNFRISDSDYLVREGELVLEVGKLLRDQLRLMGAEVVLLRESSVPVIEVDVLKHLSPLVAESQMPDVFSLESWASYFKDLRKRYFRRVFVLGELCSRANLVNETVRPDLLLSLHVNAAPWPKDEDGCEQIRLVDRDHSHVLVFGGVTPSEIQRPHHRDRLMLKMLNGSGPIEEEVGAAIGRALGSAWDLPPSSYDGRNAIALDSSGGYLWARNLLILREVDCPVILLEPFLANSTQSYPRIQQAIQNRRDGGADEDILSEYADAVSDAILAVYGPRERGEKTASSDLDRRPRGLP